MAAAGLTSVDFLQRLIGEEAEASVRHDTQNSGGEASIQRLQTLLSRYPQKHMHNVAVPVKKGQKNYSSCHVVNVSFYANCTISAGLSGDAHISFGVTAILARTMSRGYVSIAAVVPAKAPATNLGNGGRALEHAAKTASAPPV